MQLTGGEAGSLAPHVFSTVFLVRDYGVKREIFGLDNSTDVLGRPRSLRRRDGAAETVRDKQRLSETGRG